MAYKGICSTLLTFGATLVGPQADRIFLLALAVAGDGVAEDVVKFGVARELARCPQEHAAFWNTQLTV